ncbi:MAG TPA: hypothetical protein VM821_01730 [Abditibacteriaceae bacterium]|nr:hypothetical protein [Abditibacteriaceae bacterium]
MKFVQTGNHKSCAHNGTAREGNSCGCRFIEEQPGFQDNRVLDFANT